MNDRSGQVDQDARLPTSTLLLTSRTTSLLMVLELLSLQQRPVCNHEQRYLLDGSTNSDAWGFGLKAGYDFNWVMLVT